MGRRRSWNKLGRLGWVARDEGVFLQHKGALIGGLRSLQADECADVEL